MESADFDLFESFEEVKRLRHMRSADHRRRGALRWLLYVVLGAVVALVALAVTLSSQLLLRWKIGVLGSMIEEEQEGRMQHGGAFGVFVAISVASALGAGCLVEFVAPMAAGSGISEVKAVLNGVHIPGALTATTLAAKMAGLVLAVGSSLPVGKEGPMVHAGSAVAANLAFGDFRGDAELRDFVGGGAGTGVAAAFDAPIGGLLFCIEEGCTFWPRTQTWRTLVSTMVAAWLLSLILSSLPASVGGGGSPLGVINERGIFSFGTFINAQNDAYAIYEIAFFLALGAAGGVLGAAWVRVSRIFFLWRQQFISSSSATTTSITTTSTATSATASSSSSAPPPAGAPRRSSSCAVRCGAKESKRLVELAVLTAAVCTTYYLLAEYAGECLESPLAREARTGQAPSTPRAYLRFLRRLRCPPGFYNDLGSFFFNAPEDVMHLIFHWTDDPSFLAPWKLVGAGAVYLSLVCLTFGSAVPMGLFVPSLLAGSAAGRAVGEALRRNGISSALAGTYALIGAAATLGGIGRMTVSLAVMLIEATGDIGFGLPLILTLTASRYVGNLLSLGVYDQVTKLRKYPVLDMDKPHQSEAPFLAAEDVMVPREQVVCLRAVERLDRVMHVLATTRHNAFPVLLDTSRDWDGGSPAGRPGSPSKDAVGVHLERSHRNAGDFGGIIRRRDLLALLILRRHVEPREPGPRQLRSRLRSRMWAFGAGPDDSQGPSSLNGDPEARLLGGGEGRESQELREQAEVEEGRLLHATLLRVAADEDAAWEEAQRAVRREDEGGGGGGEGGGDAEDEARTGRAAHRLLDLRPFLNPTPFTVHVRAPLARVYRLFRGIGLRHLVCVDDAHDVAGLITRTALTEANIRRTFLRKEEGHQ